MTQPIDLVARLLDRLGEPRDVALARHSPRSLARFHPLAHYARWEVEYFGVKADLIRRGARVTEIFADDAPASIGSSKDLARWVESQIPMQKGDPYRLGISIGADKDSNGRVLNGALGWCAVRLGKGESGVDQ